MVTQMLTREDESVEATLVDTQAVRRARAQALPERTVGTLASLFAALGESSRLRIVHALSEGEMCVSDLAAVLGMAVPAVSQHLRVLRDLRIVCNRRAGKLVYYALDDAHVAELFAVTLAHVRGGEEQEQHGRV